MQCHQARPSSDICWMLNWTWMIEVCFANNYYLTKCHTLPWPLHSSTEMSRGSASSNRCDQGDSLGNKIKMAWYRRLNPCYNEQSNICCCNNGHLHWYKTITAANSHSWQRIITPVDAEQGHLQPNSAKWRALNCNLRQLSTRIRTRWRQWIIL